MICDKYGCNKEAMSFIDGNWLCDSHFVAQLPPDPAEMAAELSRITAERDRLIDERDVVRLDIDALILERDALRMALKGMVGCFDPAALVNPPESQFVRTRLEVARAALSVTDADAKGGGHG